MPCGGADGRRPTSSRDGEVVDLDAVDVNLADGGGVGGDVDDGERVDVGDELLGEGTPRGGAGGLVRVVERGAPGPGDEVDHPRRAGLGRAVERLVERPIA